MLVLTVKRKSCITINDGETLIQFMRANKKGLLMKVMLRNDDNTYSIDDTYISTKEEPAQVTDNLKVIHLKGGGKEFKIGLEGFDKVYRCEPKFKFTVARHRNLDDDFFNFDTEGY